MRRMHAHNSIVAETTHQSRFLPVVRAQVIVIRHAIGNKKSLAYRRPIEPTGKVNPFAAIARPRFSAKRLGHAGHDQGLLEFCQMFAHHMDQRLIAGALPLPPSIVFCGREQEKI